MFHIINSKNDFAFARSTRDGLQILADVADMRVRVVSVSENVDFGDSTGRLIASILLSVASFEREVTVERIRAGMAAARESGKHIGRPRDEKTVGTDSQHVHQGDQGDSDFRKIRVQSGERLRGFENNRIALALQALHANVFVVPTNPNIQTQSLPDEHRDVLISDIRAFFPDVEDSGKIIALSVQPPAWIQLAADAATWGLVFKVAATKFLYEYAKTLGTKAAEGTPNKIIEFVACFRRLASRIKRRVSFGVQLWTSDSRRVLLPLAVDEVSACHTDFARLIVHGDVIAKIINQLPVMQGDVRITFSEHSFQLMWLEPSKDTWSICSYKYDGQPIELPSNSS